ncbi:GNAT family N-acyltransferase [Paenibacillus filicis]|uniref:GNAT family N-acyltransferase n=1 Tax=Paenibacillus filicis TaxID=669464 RepID=A0ABU9DIC2_9BACL
MLASTENEVEQALRLRYRVFVEEEQNMRLRADNGLEQDAYDDYCDHLIVKDLTYDQVIGTYRLLPGDRTLASGGFYSETEFDLSGFTPDKNRTLELGRSCIDPAYRDGKAIQLLWEGIASYLAERELFYLIGCASVHLQTLDEVNRIYSYLRRKQVITDRFSVRPLETHRIGGLRMVDEGHDDKELFRSLPPLMKGYQWLGAEIGGDPAYDGVFDTVDFFIVLEKDRLAKRYKKRFMAG